MHLVVQEALVSRAAVTAVARVDELAAHRHLERSRLKCFVKVWEQGGIVQGTEER